MADFRLALPVVIAWCSAAVMIAFPHALPSASLAAWAVAIAATVLAVVLSRRGWLATVAVTLVAIALLLAVASAHAPVRQPAGLLDASTHGRFVRATVVTTETVHPGAQYFRGTITQAQVGTRSSGTEVPVLVFASMDAAAAPIGIATSLRLEGTLAAADPASGIAFRFFAGGKPSVVGSPPPLLDWANALRESFRRAASTLPGDGGALLPGLAIGDTGAVSESLDAAMKTSSLSHLTAVSGANCAVVIGLVMIGGARLGLSRRARIGASIVVLAAFVVLVTPEPSVLRAAVMAVIVLSALARGRPVHGLPVLALAAYVLLVLDPWLARDYGFVLSVLATGGLLLLAGPLAKAMSRWLPASVSAVIAVPLAAQLACQPVLILLAPVLPTWGILANMLAEPAAPLATVLGLVACSVLPWWPGAGQVIASVAWVPSAWIAGIARFFAAAPGHSIPWPPGVTGVLLITGVTVMMLVFAFRDRRARTVAAAGLALALVAYIGIVGGTAVTVQLGRPANWQFAACDIGQGDAVLIRSLGRVALIDTGPEPALLTRCLDTLGIDRIDLLVLTHYDLDHVGGAAAVFGRVGVAMVGPMDGGDDERLVRDLAGAGAEVRQASRGMEGMLGDLRWQVLWPKEKLGTVDPGNDASVTISVSAGGDCPAGCLSGLFLGDLGERPQALMMAANRLGTVDVVKVAHHGSADQLARLYERIHATVGLVSVGADNRYGHPTEHLLQILSSVGTLAARTDQQGLILVSPAPGGRVGVWSERAPSVGGAG
ncbi:MAG: ComEC/Rec2 family competence protein [Microbacteriaceae bacterium]|nr:ComEC/Rec2 family competence protein [Microbacteriaceae bacterium]